MFADRNKVFCMSNLAKSQISRNLVSNLRQIKAKRCGFKSHLRAIATQGSLRAR